MGRKLTDAQREITTTIETITPIQANKLLELQDESQHRPIKRQVMLRYARDMREGRWLLNGETIILNGSTIIDGRHRLSAVVAAEVPVQFLIVRGVDASVFLTVDSGGARTPGDVLHIAGFANANMLSAAAKLCFLYDHYGRMDQTPWVYPSRSELLAYLDENKDALVSATRWVGASRSRRSVTRPGVICALYALCSQGLEVERDVFFDELVTGVNLSMTSPIRLVRERLMREQIGRKKPSSPLIAAYIIKAWNAEMTRRPLRVIRWTSDEPFPLMVNRPPKHFDLR